jgi:stage V sporulation protein G
MEIREIRIKLDPNPAPYKDLLAYVSFTIDGAFVVHDVRVIRTARGNILSFPARKIHDRCPRCETKTPLVYRHCPQCGLRLAGRRVATDPAGVPMLMPDGRPQTHMDVCHPINGEARAAITEAVLSAYREALASGEAHYTHHDAPVIA